MNSKTQELEQVLVSTLIKSEEKRKLIFSQMSNIDHYFIYPNIKNIIRTIKELHDKNNKIDVDTLLCFSSEDNNLIKSIASTVDEIDTQNIPLFLKTLKENTLEYDVSNVYSQDILRIFSDKKDPSYKAKALLDVCQEIERRQQIEDSKLKSIEKVVEEYKVILDIRKNGSSFYTTGDVRVNDRMNYGYCPKQITVVAGRPSNGKSLFRLDNAKKLSALGVPTVIFNLEMQNENDIDRLISMNTQIDASRLIKKFSYLNRSEVVRIYNEIEKIKTLKLFMYDDPLMDMEKFKIEIIKKQEQLGKEYMVVYIDLFTKFVEFSNAESALDFEKICNRFQRLVKQLGIHAILVLQINRSADKERLKSIKDIGKVYPMLSHIKNAGAFEEMADNVFLISRPSNYLHQYEWGEYVPDYMRLDIAKQRGGSSTTLSNEILYKNNNNYLGLITPPDKWDPLQIDINIDDIGILAKK